jgi:hypothetical protein
MLFVRIIGLGHPEILADMDFLGYPIWFVFAISLTFIFIHFKYRKKTLKFQALLMFGNLLVLIVGQAVIATLLEFI